MRGCKKSRERRGKRLENAFPSKIYAIILAHFFTAIFFAWVNLCKKDSTRRPGFKGAPLFAERPRSRVQSPTADLCLEGGITMKGLHIIADLYNCQKGDFLVSADKLRELCVNACI